MELSASQVIVWLVVGAVAGSFVGAIFTRSKEGYGRIRNFALGLAGAAVGGLLFRLFRIDLGLAEISISAEDLVAAVLGSALLISGHAIWKRSRQRRAANAP